MPLSSRVQLASPGWIIFGTIEVESQPMAAAVTAKAASDILVRLFLAMLDAWGRSDAKMLLRSDQEVTMSLILREVQERRQHKTLVERSPLESHGTIGAMERANRILGEVLRTLKHATETRVWRQTEDGSAAHLLDGTTFLLGLLLVSRETRRKDPFLRRFGIAVTEAEWRVLGKSSGRVYLDRDCCVACKK